MTLSRAKRVEFTEKFLDTHHFLEKSVSPLTDETRVKVVRRIKRSLELLGNKESDKLPANPTHPYPRVYFAATDTGEVLTDFAFYRFKGAWVLRFSLNGKNIRFCPSKRVTT